MIDLLRQEFVQHAFIAGALVAATAGLIGYFAVLRAQAFSAHALAHIGFAGAAGAALFGINALAGTMAFNLCASLGITLLEKNLRGRDVEIGLVLSFALGLGVLFLHLYTHAATAAINLLFGSLLSVSAADVQLCLSLCLACFAVIGALFRPLLFASIDPVVAEAKGVPVKTLALIFNALLAVSVAAAIKVVGVLLVFALLIAPAAAAQHVSRSPAGGVLLSIALGLAYVWGGLMLAIKSPFPVSFYIASLASLGYFTLVSAAHLIKPHRRHELAHHHGKN